MSEGTFIRKETEVQAIQWTGQNFWAVYDFISKQQQKKVKMISIVVGEGNVLSIVMPSGELIIGTGGWLSYSDSAGFVSISSKEFSMVYRTPVEKEKEQGPKIYVTEPVS